MSTATLLRRVGKVHTTLFDAQGYKRTGVMTVPPILGLDEWEEIAMPMQRALQDFCLADTSNRPLHQVPEWTGVFQGSRVVTRESDPYRNQLPVPKSAQPQHRPTRMAILR